MAASIFCSRMLMPAMTMDVDLHTSDSHAKERTTLDCFFADDLFVPHFVVLACCSCARPARSSSFWAAATAKSFCQEATVRVACTALVTSPSRGR